MMFIWLLWDLVHILPSPSGKCTFSILSEGYHLGWAWAEIAIAKHFQTPDRVYHILGPSGIGSFNHCGLEDWRRGYTVEAETILYIKLERWV